MKNKKLVSLVIGVIALILGIGFSLGFYTASNNTGKNSGNEVSGSTNKTPDTIFKSEELLKPNNTNIYPGHKSIAAIKVTATGVNDVVYDLTWSGTNTLGNYNYTLYKTSTEERPEFKCQVKTKNIENVGNVYYEECTSDLSSLGEAIDEGIIEKSTENITIKLLENQLMNATTTGNSLYYYLVLEFPNIDEAQEGQGGKFTGALTATKKDIIPDVSIIAAYIEQEGGKYKESLEIPGKTSGYGLNTEKSVCNNNAEVSWDYEKWGLITTNLNKSGTNCNLYFDILKGQTMDEILASYNTSTRSSFDKIYQVENSKTVFTAVDDYGSSKYFAGAPTDNYVKFAGFYWRIVRMNGNKTTRLIYVRKASIIDALSNKQAVLANGYDDSSTNYTTAFVSKFNEKKDDNAYVGFKYTVGSLRGLSEKSTILSELDTWYETNLKPIYGKYLDGSTGFCGDRTPYLCSDSICNSPTSGGGTGTTTTYYAAYLRLYFQKSPVLTCADNRDLYTTKTANFGNKNLENPIGLITSDELSFAGGAPASEANSKYYLNNNTSYWAISPMAHENATSSWGTATNLYNAIISMDHVTNMHGVRPVINLAATTRFAGSGTWDDPYTVI